MSQFLSRREMMRRAAALGVGASVGGSVRFAHAARSANEDFRLACIGVGGRGWDNVRGIAKDAKIVALCDVDENRANKAYEKFDDVKKFTDFRKMFDAMESEIDGVMVSTPDHTHFHPSLWALERGKHLYCEKPLAHNVWECRQLTDMARERGLATQLGAQRHAMHNMHRVVEIVQSGMLGPISEVHCWVGGERGMPGDATSFPSVPPHLDWDLWLGPAAERRYSPAYVPYKWRFWWDFGTGETGNWGCHILDIPFWALGLKYPTHVSAGGPEVHPDQTPKSMQCHFDFPATDDRGPVKLHWSHGVPAILKEHDLPSKGMNTLFVGKEGMLLCGFSSKTLYPKEKFADTPSPEKTIPKSPGFYREWIQAARGGDPATCHFDYSGPLAETVLLGNVAYRAGSGFDWDSETLSTGGNTAAQDLIREEYRDGWRVDLA